MASSTALAPRYEPPMPMQMITSAFSRSFAACFSMASIRSGVIDEGRCTQPRKSLPAPLPDSSRALAACALACIAAETATPVLEMSNFRVSMLLSN